MYAFGAVSPANVVLGNWRFSGLEAAIYAGFWVTFFLWLLWDLAIAKGVRFDTGAVTMGYFWSANIFAVWLVSRFSQYAGLGITSYWWAILMALVTYFVQRLVFHIIAGRNAA